MEILAGKQEPAVVVEAECQDCFAIPIRAAGSVQRQAKGPLRPGAEQLVVPAWGRRFFFPGLRADRGETLMRGAVHLTEGVAIPLPREVDRAVVSLGLEPATEAEGLADLPVGRMG